MGAQAARLVVQVTAVGRIELLWWRVSSTGEDGSNSPVAPHPLVQVTCAITAPRANLRVLLREHVMTPAVSGYASALALSKATSAMRVDGNIS